MTQFCVVVLLLLVPAVPPARRFRRLLLSASPLWLAITVAGFQSPSFPAAVNCRQRDLADRDRGTISHTFFLRVFVKDAVPLYSTTCIGN